MELFCQIIYQNDSNSIDRAIYRAETKKVNFTSKVDLYMRSETYEICSSTKFLL